MLIPGADEEQARLDAQALLELDDSARADVLPPAAGVLPVALGAVIVGVAAAVALARRIIDIVCRFRKCGITIDARITPIQITESPQLPGGTVFVISANGEVTRHDVCGSDVDLGRILTGLAET